jgi:CPA2 family monovalent cation:H+ antiporter-2
MILASGTGVPSVLPELVALVGAAALIGYLSSRLRVVPIVGFLLAGVLVGPEQLGLVREQEVVDTVAEIGVILLLFTIGLEFSLDRLNQIRRLILVGGGLQVALATGVTAGGAMAFGVAPADAVFSGLLVSLSSTAIVLKLLAERREAGTARGQAATAVLLFQDLAVVAMVLLVPILGGAEGAGPADIPIALGKAALLVVGVLVVARRLMPPLLDVVARTCSPEVFLLTIVAVCFGTALGSAALGVSLSLGAFLAGMVVSESRHGTHAFGEILPLQILFSATFFVSVGMLLDASFLLEEPLLVAGFVAGIVAIKALTGAAAVGAVGVGAPVALGSGLLLAQVGEFSFVLDQVGRDAGLSALGLGADGSQALIAATVVLMIATPALSAAGAALERRTAPRMAAGRERRRPLDLPAGRHENRRDHALVLGYGSAAHAAVAELRRFGLGFTVLTLNPDAARQAAADGMDVVVGDYAKRAVLTEAGAPAARLVVIADDDVERTHRVVAAVRVLNPDAAIVTRPLGDPDVAEFSEAGADHVVTPERASRIGLAIAIRAVLGGGDGTVPLSTVLHYRPQPNPRCGHLGEIRAVQPSAYGCEECLRDGTAWVHLRICLTCGHVGCCDTSEHKHARAHSGSAAHPLIANLEPGERWAYCFPDDEMLSPAAR